MRKAEQERLAAAKAEHKRLATERLLASMAEQVLPEDNTEEAVEGNECVICMDEPPSHVLIPCGHKCLCDECAASGDFEKMKAAGIVQCPICRAPIRWVMKATDVKVYG